jgi:hypothetical protein
MSLIPWSQGRAAIWDVTIHDTLVPLYIKLSSSRAGAVADNASGQKRRLYHDLSSSYHLIPIAMGVGSNVLVRVLYSCIYLCCQWEAMGDNGSFLQRVQIVCKRIGQKNPIAEQ